MKKLITSVVASLALTTASLSAADYYASVDGERITKSDVQMILQNPNIDFEQLPKTAQTKVIDQIITAKLLVKQAKADGVEKDAEFQKALNALKDNLLLQAWQQKQLKEIKVTDAQKEKFFNENKERFKIPTEMTARHILLKTEDEAKAVIKELNKAKSDKKEAKFIELAKTKSVGPTGKDGGNLNTFKANQMVPEFAKAAEALKKDTYSKTPVKTQFGYHVIYLNDKKPGKSLSFNEVKGNISKILIQKEFSEQLKKISEKLRKESKIVIK